jgi:hypothetical protein
MGSTYELDGDTVTLADGNGVDEGDVDGESEAEGLADHETSTANDQINCNGSSASPTTDSEYCPAGSPRTRTVAFADEYVPMASLLLSRMQPATSNSWPHATSIELQTLALNTESEKPAGTSN